MTRLRFVAPAGTPVGMADLAWWLRHALTDRDTVLRFGEEIRARCGIRHCTFVSTGRAALTLVLLALKNLDGGRRDEVAIPSYTCFSVASSVVKAGLKIRLVDIDPATLDFSSEALERTDWSRVLAVVATNLYGLPNDLPTITKIARSRNVFVVDDAAQCLGGSVGGRHSGTWGDAGIYSLDKGKNITSIDGGVIVTNSDAVAAALTEHTRTLRQPTFGQTAANIAKLLAYASMLHPTRYWIPNALPFLSLGTTVYRTDYPLAQYDSWLAPMGRRLFARLDAVNARRVGTADQLMKDLPWGPNLQPVRAGRSSAPVYLRLPVLVGPEIRDTLVAACRRSGIGATASYPASIHDIPEVTDYLRSGEQDAIGARMVADRIVTLPTHPYVTAEDRAHMATVVADVLGDGRGR